MSSIKNFLPPNYRVSEHELLPALIQAIESGDNQVIDVIAQARAQLFLTSAEGSYLTSLANSYGFAIPPNAGLDENGFRKLSKPAIWAPKQSIPTINQIAELFYGSAVLHPYVTSTVPENFSLQDGDQLVFETDAGEIAILFEAEKFADISDVSASEMASAINNQSGDVVFAEAFLDRSTGLNVVRVVAKSFGSAAKIRVAGGSAQNIIQFQNLSNTTAASGTEWLITKKSGAVYSNRVIFTWSGNGTDPSLFNANIGDLVTIRGLKDGLYNFSQLNGSYNVLDVGADFFEIENLAFQQSGVTYTQVLNNEFIFTSDKFQTLFDNEEIAVVSETKPGELDISVPAVPPIVRRQLRGATRLRGAAEKLLEIRQNQVVVPYPNQLPDSGTFIITSDRFEKGFQNRFLTYSSKSNPTGSEQVLNIDPTGAAAVPAVSSAQSATALSSIPSLKPIFGEVDNPDIRVQTPDVRHNFENAQEITINGASVSIELFKHKTVPTILCPVGQESTFFEHDMDSELLYVQFYTEDTNELAHLVYEPEASDPENRTKFFYVPELEGRFLKAVIVRANPNIIAGDPTGTIGPNPMIAGGNSDVLVHNYGTEFVTFSTLDSNSKQKITGSRKTLNPNESEFTYSFPAGVSDYDALLIDHQQVFPDLVRAVATDFLLPASMGKNTVTLVHNLFSSSLIVEIRVADPGATNLETDSFLPFPQITINDDTSFDITYENFNDDVRVDVFITASFFNPLESVHGGLLPDNLNGNHLVRLRLDEDSYTFRLLGTGIAPVATGTIITTGKTVNGTGTQFLSDVDVGNFIAIPNGQKRLVESVTSDTELELSQAFNPSQGTPIQYRIVSPEQNDTPFGEYVTYDGAVIFGFNVTYDPDVERKTNIRFVFPDRVSRQNAGFIDGTKVSLIEAFGFDIQGAVASFLKGIELTVHSQDLNFVYFSVNISANNGIIIQGAKCRRSGFFGGENFTHFIEQPLSQNNKNGWFKNARILLLDSDLPPNDLYVGSYLYDTDGTQFPFTVSKTSTFLTSAVNRLSAPGTLNVSDISEFPASGQVFIDFGNDSFEGPIDYRFKINGNPNQLVIDPAYVFKQSHNDNSIVRLVSSDTKVELSQNASEFPVYLTGVVEARRTLEEILEDIVSVGVKLNINVQIPELKYDETSLQPFV